VQAFRRGRRLALKNQPVSHRLHAQHADIVLHQDGQHFFLKAIEVRVHEVERHLHGIEMEVILFRLLKHVKVNVRVLVAGEADVPDLARPFCVEKGLHGASRRKDAVGILEANDFVVLQKVYVVYLKALQRFVDLFGGFLWPSG
jgi:hypothetical protein